MLTDDHTVQQERAWNTSYEMMSWPTWNDYPNLTDLTVSKVSTVPEREDKADAIQARCLGT